MLEGPSSALASLLARGDCLKSVHPKRRAAALANLRRAVALLEAYEAGVAPSPAGVAAYLRSALRRGAADPEASAEAGGDTVKVMTIHASKGLEFPLVAVFGLEQGAPERGKKASYLRVTCWRPRRDSPTTGPKATACSARSTPVSTNALSTKNGLVFIMWR